MAQTKFDKQVEETAEAVVFGIGRFLAGRPMDGERKTDATFWRKGTRVLPKVEGKVSRSSYRAGWQRLTFRITGLAATGTGGYYALWEKQDATFAAVADVWENPDPAIAAAQTGGIGLVSAAAVGSAAYGLATRKRRESMREWVTPLHEALAVPLGMSELTDPRRYLHVPGSLPTTTRRYASTPPDTCGSTRTWSPTSSSRSSPWRTSPSPGAARARTRTSSSRSARPRPRS